MEFTFKHYRHEPFRHLEFDILDEWESHKNELEVVFTDAEEQLPQLFMQALSKSIQYQDTDSLFAFIKKQNPDQTFLNPLSTSAGKFPAMSFDYQEQGFAHIHVYTLLVDVDEGILWFYLKVPSEHAASFQPIIARLQSSLSFHN